MKRILGCFKWGWPLLVGLLLVTLGLAIFVGLAREVVEKKAFGFDQNVLTWLAQVASSGLTRFMLVVSDSATAYLDRAADAGPGGALVAQLSL